MITLIIIVIIEADTGFPEGVYVCVCGGGGGGGRCIMGVVHQ